MAYYRPTPEQHLAMFPDGEKVNSVRSLNVATAAALGITADRITEKEQGSGMMKPITKGEHQALHIKSKTQREGWACMRMRSMTPETVCIADGLVFISEDEARKYGNEMLTDGYVISHVTWED